MEYSRLGPVGALTLFAETGTSDRPGPWRRLAESEMKPATGIELRPVKREPAEAAYGWCFLCARPYELLEVEVFLHVDGERRGAVCDQCLETSAEKVADLLRARATRLRRLLSPHDWQYFAIGQSLADLEALAECIENLPTWGPPPLD